jgi:2-polyprenyl-3-methyl-5-hydroxy-6-metoxy-1,4-benzoquinol methylase
MHVLYTNDQQILREGTQLFDQYMEPLLKQLETFDRASKASAYLPEIAEYLHTCRWPFRRLEYSYALDVLLEHLKPGDRYLDAGSGVTPLAHVLARRGIQTDACDANTRLIEALGRLGSERIYGTRVAYSVQDLTAASFPDATFDAISCISVLEHIPAPHDQQAVRELLRMLKPGGILVLTVDFMPAPKANRQLSRLSYYVRRTVSLARQGELHDLRQGLARKMHARQVVRQSGARQPRSANQCFELAHLEQDIVPVLHGQPVSSRMRFLADAGAVTEHDARHFWRFDGLYDAWNGRAVLPAAWIIRKPAERLICALA